jgi:hypothetical protein
MKKVSFLFVVAGIALFVACGPSKKEKEAAIQKAKDDSMNAAMEAQRQADSIANKKRSGNTPFFLPFP